MADDKLKAGPESPGEGSVGDAQTVTKPPVPETVEEPAAGTGPVRQPEQSVTPGMGGDVPAQLIWLKNPPTIIKKCNRRK